MAIFPLDLMHIDKSSGKNNSNWKARKKSLKERKVMFHNECSSHQNRCNSFPSNRERKHR
jgi:hypothetical protein